MPVDRVMIKKDSDWDAEGWTTAPNRIIRDEGLSMQARWLWVYIASHVETWVLRMAALQKVAGCGRDKLRKIIGELEDAGLLCRAQQVNPDGRYGYLTYRLRNRRSEPATENPATVEPATEDTTPLRTPSLKNTRTTEDQEPSAELALVEAEPRFVVAVEEKPIHAGMVTAAWIDGVRTNGTEPSKAQIGRVARTARELLEKNDPQRVLTAATAAGEKGHAALDSELTISNGRPWTSRRQSKDERLMEFMRS